MRLDERLGWKGLALLAVVVLAPAAAEPRGTGKATTTRRRAPRPRWRPRRRSRARHPRRAWAARHRLPRRRRPTTSVAYTQDILPILENDCVRCHSQFGTYSGVMAYVVTGSASSRLVRATQSGGSMNRYLSGDKAGKAELIRRWVVENAAAESR